MCSTRAAIPVLGEDKDVLVVAFAPNALTIVGIQRHAAVAECGKHTNAVPRRPPQKVQNVLHVRFVERLRGVVVSGDSGIDLAAADDEHADRVVPRLTQCAEHGLGPVWVIVSLCVPGIGIECGVITAGSALRRTQTNIVEALHEEGSPGFLENKLRPVFARSDADPFERLLCRRNRGNQQDDCQTFLIYHTVFPFASSLEPRDPKSTGP